MHWVRVGCSGHRVCNSDLSIRCSSSILHAPASNRQPAAKSQRLGADSNSKADALLLLATIPATTIDDAPQACGASGIPAHPDMQLPHTGEAPRAVQTSAASGAVSQGHADSTGSSGRMLGPPLHSMEAAASKGACAVGGSPIGAQASASAAQQLMAAIKRCSTWQELRFLHQQRRSEFNHLHLTAMVSKLAQEQQQRPLRPSHQPDLAPWLLGVMNDLGTCAHSLGGRELSTVLWAAVKLRWYPCDASWLLALCTRIEHRARVMRARDIATIVWSLSYFAPSTTPAGGPALITLLLNVSAPLLPTFNAQDLSLLLVGLGRLTPPLPPGWLAACLKEVGIKITACSPQALANILHSLRLLNHHPPPLWMDTFLFEASCKAPAFTPQALATILGSLAALGHRCPPRALDALLEASVHRLAHANTQDLSSMLWALARLRHPPPPGWAAAAMDALTRSAPSLLPSELALSLWGIAKLQLPVPDALLHRLASASRALLRRCNPQDLAQLVWAWGALRISPGPEWLHRAANVMAAHVQSAAPRALAHIMVGFAQLEHVPEQRWLLRVLAHVGSRMGQCSAGDLLDLSWALARLRVKPYRTWTEQYCEALRPHLPSLQPRQLVGLAWSLSRLEATPGEALMEALVEACLGLMPAMSAKELSMLALALASLGPPVRLAPALCDALVQSSHPRLRSYDNQCLVGMLRCAAALPCLPPASWVGRAADVVYHRMSSMSTGSLLTAALSLGQLGHHPSPGWLARLYAAMHPLLPELSAPHMRRLLEALAGLAQRPGAALPGVEWQSVCMQRLLQLMPVMPTETMVVTAEACSVLRWELPEEAVQRVQATTCGEWYSLDTPTSLALLRFAGASRMQPQRVWVERSLQQYRRMFSSLSVQQREAYLRLLLQFPCSARAGYLQRFSSTMRMLCRRLPAAEAAKLRALLRRLQLQHSCQPG